MADDKRTVRVLCGKPHTQEYQPSKHGTLAEHIHYKHSKKQNHTDYSNSSTTDGA